MSLRSEGFKIFALNPPILLDPSLPIAASRAGHTGLLDLQYAALASAPARQVLLRLARQAHGHWGVKLRAGQLGELAQVAQSGELQGLSFLLLVPDAKDDLVRAIAAAQHLGEICGGALEIALEVRNHSEAEAAVTAGATALVAKGHEAAGVVGSDTAFLLVQRLVGACGVPVYAQGGVSTETAAALRVAGAAGVLLDWQLALTEEAALPEPTGRQRGAYGRVGNLSAGRRWRFADPYFRTQRAGCAAGLAGP